MNLTFSLADVSTFVKVLDAHPLGAFALLALMLAVALLPKLRGRPRR